MYVCIFVICICADCSNRVVRDVIFVIDTSSSIGSSRFQLVRELIENITINVKVNSPETLFGLITFDNFARYQFNISTYTNLSTLLPAINPGLTYYGGYSTNTASALSLLLSGSAPGSFLQLRNETSNVAIVITDGYSSSYSSLYLAANALHAANIFDVYAVGIGNNNYNELQLIASDPSLVFSTYSLNTLTAQLLEEYVIDQLCSSKWLYCSTGIVQVVYICYANRNNLAMSEYTNMYVFSSLCNSNSKYVRTYTLYVVTIFNIIAVFLYCV